MVCKKYVICCTWGLILDVNELKTNSELYDGKRRKNEIAKATVGCVECVLDFGIWMLQFRLCSFYLAMDL